MDSLGRVQDRLLRTLGIGPHERVTRLSIDLNVVDFPTMTATYLLDDKKLQDLTFELGKLSQEGYEWQEQGDKNVEVDKTCN